MGGHEMHFGTHDKVDREFWYEYRISRRPLGFMLISRTGGRQGARDWCFCACLLGFYLDSLALWINVNDLVETELYNRCDHSIACTNAKWRTQFRIFCHQELTDVLPSYDSVEYDL